jgi:amyloid beta precursor protein binding protein 1
VVKELVQELNPSDTVGEFRNEDPAAVIATDIAFFKQFTVVIATQLPPAPLSALADYCWEQRIPLVVARSSGLVGSVRLQHPEHCIVESKPDPKPLDNLRIANPFPVLAAHAAASDLSEMSDVDHAHVPYPVILIQLAAQWRSLHGGENPKTKDDKTAFKVGGRRRAGGEKEEYPCPFLCITCTYSVLET